VLFVLFGAKRLPEIGRSIGSGMREFTHGISGADAAAPDTARLESPPPVRREASHSDQVAQRSPQAPTAFSDVRSQSASAAALASASHSNLDSEEAAR